MTKEKLLQEMDAEIENILEYLKGTMKDLIYKAFEGGKKCAETDKAEEFAKEIVDHVKDMVDDIQKQLNVRPITVDPVVPFGEPITTPTWPYQPIPPFTCDASNGNVPEAHFDGGDTDGDNDN